MSYERVLILLFGVVLMYAGSALVLWLVFTLDHWTSEDAQAEAQAPLEVTPVPRVEFVLHQGSHVLVRHEDEDVVRGVRKAMEGGRRG